MLVVKACRMAFLLSFTLNVVGTAQSIEREKQIPQIIESRITGASSEILGWPFESLEIELVRIPAGEFQMGSNQGDSDEMPVHRVRIDRSFDMGRFEVTVNHFAMFVEMSGYRTDAEKEGWALLLTTEGGKKVPGANWRNPGFVQDGQEPVVCVSWNDAVAFCRWLSEMTGDEYRLPTEAEWEYSARAGSQGDNLRNLAEQAWYGDNAGRNWLDTASIWQIDEQDCFKIIAENGNRTHPVGKKHPNRWGLYDMHGNAWEWVRDWYGQEYYSVSPGTSPQGPSSGSSRLFRGGGWATPLPYCGLAERSYNWPGYRYDGLGFRVVRIKRVKFEGDWKPAPPASEELSSPFDR
jgi:sulfatase modifying factor 1